MEGVEEFPGVGAEEGAGEVGVAVGDEGLVEVEDDGETGGGEGGE